ncbi:MAG: response regulator transcription factor [Kiritimatiellae bacterium]|nr:response regulator transcription factor [Kiritimatiellia bacterium]
MRILLIEDDRKTASFIVRGLKEEGFAVAHAQDGEEGRLQALHEKFDAVVLDLMLPGLDGLSVLRSLREAGSSTPVLILSAKDSVDDRVRGLRAGGDDYLTKPFAFSELLWRVHALIRRAGVQPPLTRLSVADMEVDLLARTVRRAGRKVELQPGEFALLEYLARNAGRVVSRTMIMEHVWDYNFDPETNVVESRMSRLRAKIDAPFARALIHTIRGVGYVLREEE